MSCQRHGHWCPCPRTCPCWRMGDCDDGGKAVQEKFDRDRERILRQGR